MIEYIDKNIYKALIDNSDNLDTVEPTTEWDPYYITILEMPSFKQVFLRKKPEQQDVIKVYFNSDKDNDDKRIEELNKELNKYNLRPLFIGESQKDKVMKFKEFLKEKKEKTEETIKEKNERTEESQELKKNSKMVKVGETYEYKGRKGKTQVGKISDELGPDGENVDEVQLTAQKTPAPTGGKRKSKKSKKSKKTKKSKKSKTRKSSRKTNRRR